MTMSDQSEVKSEIAIETGDVPRGNAAGFVKYFKDDALAGFLVFLTALPLCLGISLASGAPATAGVLTAIVGAIVTAFISNSELTIKGPAAGMIVIVLGAVTDFKAIFGDDPTAARHAYQMMLAVGVIGGLIQIGFGAFRVGFLSEFFPSSTVHGMLAAIGVIIMSKQIHVALGVMNVTGEPLHQIKEIPNSFAHMNPEIALIGIVSLIILFTWPLIKVKWLKMIPGQLIVILFAIPMGMLFDLSNEHTYSLLGHDFQLSERFLVDVPKNLLSAITYPDFNALWHPFAWKWIALFALVGSLESVLSAKAIDLIDPWKRKTNFDSDVLGVGIANTLVAAIGGLPMISEIVRSRVNIDAGARTRFANFWHGICLLAFISLLPGLIHRIPLAALAAMLVYTGFRLAHPREFLHVYHVGKEQLLIFVATLVGVLAIDLLWGLAIGVAVKFALHIINGVPVESLFKPFLDVEELGEKKYLIRAKGSAIFSNWIPFKRQIEEIGLIQKNNLVIDLAGADLVDSSVMEKLHDMQRDFEQQGLTLAITGLDTHSKNSLHQFATRKRSLMPLRRLTIVAEENLRDQLIGDIVRLGASGYTILPCMGAGRRIIEAGKPPTAELVRIEAVITDEVCNRLLDYLRRDVRRDNHFTACVEMVDVVNPEKF
jgi:MFS superfamily sulfate permease-like transporter